MITELAFCEAAYYKFYAGDRFAECPRALLGSTDEPSAPVRLPEKQSNPPGAFGLRPGLLQQF